MSATTPSAEEQWHCCLPRYAQEGEEWRCPGCGLHWVANDDDGWTVCDKAVAGDRETARAEAEKRLRDLTSRLGFGDGITEPQADNDTIVRWYEERLAEANEWVESVRWMDDCFAAGHEDPTTCPEHAPLLLARAEGAAEERERIAVAIDEACPHEPDEHPEGCCEVCDYAFAVAAIARQEED